MQKWRMRDVSHKFSAQLERFYTTFNKQEIDLMSIWKYIDEWKPEFYFDVL